MYTTQWLRASELADVAMAAATLRRGGLVAFPTETVYGLGANALSGEAVARIFEAKGRPAWDPLIVHLAEVGRVSEVAIVVGELAGRVQTLSEAFWPGPLTMLLPRSAAVPDAVTAGRLLVGVRVPAHPVAQALLRAAGVPVAAPSANRFGHTSPTTAQHVLDDLDGRIDAVLDAGPCRVGVESTVLDPAPTPMIVYRAGAVTAEAIADACRVPIRQYVAAVADVEPREALPSPGVGVRHYAPDAEVRLTAGTPEALWAEAERSVAAGVTIGVLLPRDWPAGACHRILTERWGRWDDAGSLAAELFAGMRSLEARGVTVMLCPLPDPGGMKDALRDRLQKAARTR